jgi:hypothetical protein
VVVAEDEPIEEPETSAQAVDTVPVEQDAVR